MQPSELRIAADPSRLFRMAADEFTHIARDAVDVRGRFTVALSGGSTPRDVYSLISGDDRNKTTKLPWDRMHFFFGDERCVRSDHPDSNYRMASESLFSNVPIPPDNVHRVQTELPAESAAAEYEASLQEHFEGVFPQFDLVMLGLGSDGHTASLFPDTPALRENVHLVSANWVSKLQSYRITLTFPVLNNASSVMFIVSGEEKAEIVRRVVAGRPEGLVYPAARVKPATGRLLWLLDSESSARVGTEMLTGTKRFSFI